MHRLLKRPGYRLYAPDSPEAGALLAEQGLGPAGLERALACLERSEGIRVRTIVGVNEDGVFGTSREGWRSDLPDACHEPFIPLLWLNIHELLGKVPAGSTARLVKDGTLPGEALLGSWIDVCSSCPARAAVLSHLSGARDRHPHERLTRGWR
jgi:hypothetical protein